MRSIVSRCSGATSETTLWRQNLTPVNGSRRIKLLLFFRWAHKFRPALDGIFGLNTELGPKLKRGKTETRKKKKSLIEQ